MNRIKQLRSFFTVSLLAIALLIGTAFTQVTQSAFAADSRDVNDISNVKGDSSNVNQSYHKLQDATQEYRKEYTDGARPGQQEPLSDRGTNPKQAAKNVGKNTRNAFERAASSVKETLDPG